MFSNHFLSAYCVCLCVWDRTDVWEGGTKENGGGGPPSTRGKPPSRSGCPQRAAPALAGPRGRQDLEEDDPGQQAARPLFWALGRVRLVLGRGVHSYAFQTFQS